MILESKSDFVIGIRIKAWSFGINIKIGIKFLWVTTESGSEIEIADFGNSWNLNQNQGYWIWKWNQNQGYRNHLLLCVYINPLVYVSLNDSKYNWTQWRNLVTVFVRLWSCWGWVRSWININCTRDMTSGTINVHHSQTGPFGKPFVGWQSHSQYIAVSTLQDENIHCI